ncbi:hypothetical protein [Alkalihalobacillus sp. 1P02AB]|uniref:hypothetical protein n=1 Tax=Alkalihalobacillus sp. 1P02AB TaxID=3132260 RepID=UPI0039A4FA97
MEWAFLGLLTFSILIFSLSFFRQDRTKALAKEVDDLTIAYKKEIFIVNKRLKTLEEEHHSLIQQRKKGTAREQLIDDVLALKSKGHTEEEIAKEMKLTENEVISILQTKYQKPTH